MNPEPPETVFSERLEYLLETDDAHVWLDTGSTNIPFCVVPKCEGSFRYFWMSGDRDVDRAVLSNHTYEILQAARLLLR